MNFEDLATFPMEDDDEWQKSVVVGGLCLLLGFLFVPGLIAWGYVLDVMAGALEGEDEPPRFDDWGDLAVDGLKVQVVLLAYQIIPTVVGGGLFVVSFLFLFSGSEAGASMGIVGLLATVAVWGFLSLVFNYVGMAGVVNLAAEDSLGAAFDLGTVWAVSTSAAWLKAWAFFVGIYVLAGLVGMVSGGLVWPFALFYALSAGGRGFGEAFASVAGRVERTPAAAGEAV